MLVLGCQNKSSGNQECEYNCTFTQSHERNFAGSRIISAFSPDQLSLITLHGHASWLMPLGHCLQVRSCTLDTWLPDQVAFMAQTGNHAANQFYEAKLDANSKPRYGSQDVAAFIRRKASFVKFLYMIQLFCTGSDKSIRF